MNFAVLTAGAEGLGMGSMVGTLVFRISDLFYGYPSTEEAAEKAGRAGTLH